MSLLQIHFIFKINKALNSFIDYLYLSVGEGITTQSNTGHRSQVCVCMVTYLLLSPFFSLLPCPLHGHVHSELISTVTQCKQHPRVITHPPLDNNKEHPIGFLRSTFNKDALSVVT